MTPYKINKKIWFIFMFLGALVPYGFGLALEVDYPVVNNSIKLTANTPLADYLKYLFDFGMLVGILSVIFSLAYAGVLFMFGSVSPEAGAKARDRISGAISGFLILITFYLVITTINPQLKFFKMDELEKIPDAPPPGSTPGVYFYKGVGCPTNEQDVEIKTSSSSDIGELGNKVRSVRIVNVPEQAYISVLYDYIGFQGKCQYINPNSACEAVKIQDPTILGDTSGIGSVSVHQYDFTPNGDGVYFYRKPFFDEQGGVVKVSNSDIIASGGIYIKSLQDLSFGSSGNCAVPEKEQECEKWDNAGKCVQKKCPALAENISSIKINGNYYVMLLFFDQKNDAPQGPWTFCQEFPTDKDVNKDGPLQIKWEEVKNFRMKPNFVIIFPVQQK